MEKIVFKNFGEDDYLESKINSTNLNNLQENIEMAIDKAMLEVPKNKINPKTDLNDLTEVGTYVSENPEITKSLVNCPAQEPFKLIVQDLHLENRKFQFIIEHNNNLWWRQFTYNGWTDWKSDEKPQGIYRLTNQINIVNPNTIVNLSDNINNYDFLIFATGVMGTNTYRHSLSMPFTTQYALNKKTRGLWRAKIDTITVFTASGKIAISITTLTELKIESIVGSDGLRGIFGVKLF